MMHFSKLLKLYQIGSRISSNLLKPKQSSKKTSIVQSLCATGFNCIIVNFIKPSIVLQKLYLYKYFL